MSLQQVTLEGKHVILEPLSEAHLSGLVQAGLDSSLWQYMPYGNLSDENAMSAWVQGLLRSRAEGTDQPYTVIHRESGKIAGATRFLEIRPEHRGLEIGGTWYGIEYQRTMVNTNTKYLMLRHAFEVLGCVRVQFKTDARNEKSIRAIERLGAQREARLRNHMIMEKGVIRDSIYFSILDSEWPVVKTRLEGMLAR